jgi:hypothetical protein
MSCDDAPHVRKQLAACRCALETAIAERFQRAVDEGDLPTGTSATALAQYLSTVMQGLSIQSANGATHAELRRIADIALSAFPEARGTLST